MASLTTRRARQKKHQQTTLEPTVPRAVFYKRVSSDEQEEKGTIASQGSYLQMRYEADFRVDAPPTVRMDYVGEYADDGYSGALPLGDRPAGRRLLDDARAGKFDVVIVYKVDRLGRRARVLIDAHDELESYGVAITSATEPFDTRPGPQQHIGRFVFQLLASIAELDRANIAINTMNGKHRVAREGRFVNGCVPFGYDVDDDEHLVPSQRTVPQLGITESDMVREIFRRVGAGDSCYLTADWLTKAGVPSLRYLYNKQLRRLVEGGNTSTIWTNRRVWETIKNPVYKGDRLLSFGASTYEHEVPELVTTAVWELANQKMKTANKWNGLHDDFVYLLSKKLKCSGSLADGQPCGCVYTGGLSNHVRYYHCNGNDATNAKRRGSRCGVPAIRTDMIESLIWSDLAWALRHPGEVLERLQAELRAHQGENSGVQQRVDEVRQQRTELDKVAAHLRQSLLNPRRPAAEIEEDLIANGKAIARLDERLAELEAHLYVDQALERRLTDTALIMQRTGADLDRIERTNDRMAMRRLFDLLVDEVLVVRPGKDAEYRVRYAFALPTGHERPLVAESTTRVRSATNIRTLVVGQTENPWDRRRTLD